MKEYILKDILLERKEYSEKGKDYKHVTLSKEGIVDKTERYNRDFLVKDENKKYKITHLNDICYNPANLKFGVICLNRYGDAIFSPIYITFELKEKYKQLIDIEYLSYILTSERFIQKVRKYEQGTVYERMAVNVEDFLSMKVNIPSLNEQKIIKDMIKKVEKIINLYELLIKDKNDYIKAQFKNLFGELSNSKFKYKKIQDIVKIDTNMTKDFEKYSDLPHIGIENIEKNTGKLINYISVKESKLTSGKYIFDERHIIYSKIRPNLNKVAIPNFKGLCSADSYPLLVTEECNKKYLAYVLRSNFFLDYIVGCSSRTNIPKVNKEQLNSFKIPVPPIKLQKNFEVISNNLERQIENIEYIKQNYMELQKGLLQQLLTGKIKVKI